MKYLIVVLDGLSENLIEDKTSLELSETINLDYLYQRSSLYQVNCIKDKYLVASDVANMAILGYDPDMYYSGRAYLELKAQGIDLKHDEFVYRLNLVELSNEVEYKDKTMVDFSGNNISDDKASLVLDKVSEMLDDGSFIVKGSSYHHLLVTKHQDEFNLMAPHEIMSENIKPYFNGISCDNYFYLLMSNSAQYINDSDVNSIWLWSKSYAVDWPSFSSQYSLKAALISAVDVVKGIGKLAGLECLDVVGATGTDQTSYTNKIDKSIELLKNNDLVFLHIEACDYASHKADRKLKINCIEQIDKLVISKIREYKDDLKVMILPDHHTNPLTKMHERGSVPMMIYDNTKNNKVRQGKYQEKNFIETNEIDVLNLIEEFIV